jgi:FKBP-type peptidyl-prolyl cis-trans isomerase FkpA
MQKFLTAVSVTVITALTFTSCSTSDIDGYEKTDDGLYYKFHKHAENQPHPKQDDELQMKFVLKMMSNDSVLTDTRKVREDGIVTMLMRPVSFKGGLESAIAMMSKGDSASFIINADSFFLKTSGMKQLPPFMKPGDKLKAEVKLENFVDAKIVAEQNKKREEEQMKQFQEMEMQSKTDLDKYIADNKIKAQPTASGLYYVEQNILSRTVAGWNCF